MTSIHGVRGSMLQWPMTRRFLPWLFLWMAALGAQEVRAPEGGPVYGNFLRADALVRRMLAASGAGSPHHLAGTALLRNFTHPKHAGDFLEERAALRLDVDPGQGSLACSLEALDGAGGAERLVARDFHLWEWKADRRDYLPVAAGSGLGDQLRATTLVKLDPALVVATLAQHRENLQWLLSDRGQEVLVFAANSELWRLRVDRRTALLASIETAVPNAIYGDMTERVSYEGYGKRHGVQVPSRVRVEGGGWVQVDFHVAEAAPGASVPGPPASPEEGSYPRLAEPDIAFRELAPHLFAAELRPTNSRVFVAEFSDYLFVIEGAYTSGNGETLVRKLAERFPSKPIRYHAFSHVHGQYLGSSRAFMAAGATVVTTPTGAEVVRRMARGRRRYQPDGLAPGGSPKIEVVGERRGFEDEMNALTVFNVESDHTDDYNLFYFPRQGALLTGDLLFHRGAGKPLRGRSRKLCGTLAKLGIAVRTLHITWPLEGFGVTPDVAWEDFVRACELPEPAS